MYGRLGCACSNVCEGGLTFGREETGLATSQLHQAGYCFSVGVLLAIFVHA